jgi:hypothetical protein
MMITLLVDSNAMRHPGLKGYLGASRDHAIALSDLTLLEMRKSNALSTSRDSLRIVAQFPQQSYVLKRTDEILGETITSEAQTHTLFDYEETVELSVLSRRLQAIPEPTGLRDRMAQLEATAQLVMSRLTDEVAPLEAGLVEAAKDFTQAELTQIRTVSGVTDSTRRKLLDLLKETTKDFILKNQEPGRRAPMALRDATGLFAFRYSLCMLLYYMEWVRVGRTTGKALPRRVNDVVDMQVAAMGTYFNGVLSADAHLQMVSNTARAVLRGFNGYVGEDWSVPQADCDRTISMDEQPSGAS